jgi:hypothetical protein
MQMKSIVLCFAVSLALAAGLTGCRIQTDKDANGQDKKVQIDTPFGGVHVNTDQTTASDLGLPLYPGAELSRDKDNHGSADVHIGFGEWQLRVKAVSYTTPDSRDKIAAFYKKALARYGDVLTCQGHEPVGKPSVTAEGLSCADDSKHVNIKDNNNIDIGTEYQLKAGSKRHQHIVGFDPAKDGKTPFSLVLLDLPQGMDKDDGKND